METAFNEFLRAYINAALYFTTDESNAAGGDPLANNYTVADFAPETIERIQGDCERFWNLTHDLIMQWGGDGPSQAGHDFWQTRNGAGVGFWEQEWNLDGQGQPGATLDTLAKSYGTFDLYIGDDQKIWGM